VKRVIIFSLLLIVVGCDKKEQVKYVAETVYDDLSAKYEALEIENKLLKRQNQKLNNENEILKHDLEKYKDGFKSMYE